MARPSFRDRTIQKGNGGTPWVGGKKRRPVAKMSPDELVMSSVQLDDLKHVISKLIQPVRPKTKFLDIHVRKALSITTLA